MLGMALLWELSARLEFVNPLFLSYPSAILREAFSLFFQTGEIYPHLRASAIEGALGLGVAAVVGIALGIVMGRFRLVREALEPIVVILYSTPAVAIFPLLMLWLGVGLLSKSSLVFVGALFPIVITTQAGVRSVDQRLIEAARSMMATEAQLFSKVLLPSSVPYIVAGLRLGIGRALIMVVVAELYAAQEGVGYFVMQAGATFETTRMFVGVAIIAFSGLLLSEGLKVLERRIAPWLDKPEED
jgi:ABC-type nitrate/sulfonate/bicarbonate transport system permease component